MIARIAVDLIQVYIVVLFVRIILTWFPTDPWSGLGRFERALGRVTDPVLAPIRRVLPPLPRRGRGDRPLADRRPRRVGGARLDPAVPLSPGAPPGVAFSAPVSTGCCYWPRTI